MQKITNPRKIIEKKRGGLNKYSYFRFFILVALLPSLTYYWLSVRRKLDKNQQRAKKVERINILEHQLDGIQQVINLFSLQQSQGGLNLSEDFFTQEIISETVLF